MGFTAAKLTFPGPQLFKRGHRGQDMTTAPFVSFLGEIMECFFNSEAAFHPLLSSLMGPNRAVSYWLCFKKLTFTQTELFSASWARWCHLCGAEDILPRVQVCDPQTHIFWAGETLNLLRIGT